MMRPVSGNYAKKNEKKPVSYGLSIKNKNECMKRTVVFLFLLLNIGVFNLRSETVETSLKWTEDVGARIYPEGTREYNVSEYGAVGDGVTMNTTYIQQAIDECARNGGGIVTFNKGNYLTGSLYLKKGVYFRVPKGTVLLGSTSLEDYPEMDTRVAGIEMRWPSALINVLDQQNVMIGGEGIIHAQGKVFWDNYWAMRRDYESRGLRWIVDYDCKRPRTLLVSNSSDVTVKDLIFRQAGFWTIQLLYSTYCTVNGVVIQNNWDGHGPSTDGVDIDSSSKILVENCDIDCNDDNFCLKSGRDADGLRVNRPTEYIVIRNCISRAGGGLMTCGSETSGGIRYVLAENLKAKGTNVGIRLKSAMNRGGTTEHIYVKNIEMDEVGTAFETTVNWNPAYSYSVLPKEYEGKEIPEHWKKMLEEVDPKVGIPHFREVYLSGFRVTNSKRFFNVVGSNESLIKHFFLKDIRAEVETAGIVSYAVDWKVEDIQLKAKDQLPVKVTESSGVVFPLIYSVEESPLPFRLPGVRENSVIAAGDHAEFAFYLPEMAGNLKFGIMINDKGKWLSELRDRKVRDKESGLEYELSDPFIGSGRLIVKAYSLKNTDGMIIEVKGEGLPGSSQLCWAYGGAYGKVLSSRETGSLKPRYCKDNVFSVERTSFTLYYGESMNLKIIHGVMPLASEIRLSDAYMQETPDIFFNSGKKTDAPALAGVLPLKNGQNEYFCIYKQNSKADYNYFMLEELFRETVQGRNKGK